MSSWGCVAGWREPWMEGEGKDRGVRAGGGERTHHHMAEEMGSLDEFTSSVLWKYVAHRHVSGSQTEVLESIANKFH